MKTLAIDIGGTKFTIAAFDGERLAARATHPTDREGGCEALLAVLDPLLTAWHREHRFTHCGIGFGGPVLWDRQVVAKSTHAPGWNDFDFPARIRDSLGVPAVIDNDANTGALGEFLYGAGRGASPFFYVTLSTGIGGGIIEDGRILRGADSWAGEIGHINVRPDGPFCLCGSNGCLERMCCGLWLERDHGAPPIDLMRRPDFVRGYVADLARGIKAALMLLNPARIAIGGGIAKAGDALFIPLREELTRQVPAWSGARIDVRPAALGDDSVLWGALGLARQSCV
jgi:glucokinase